MGKNVKKFGGTLKIVLTVIMLFCVAVFTILMDIIEPELNTDIYTTGYWIDVLLVNASVVIALFLVKSIRTDALKTTNKRYRILDGTLDVAFRKINQNGATSDFSKFLEEDNKVAKKKAYTTVLYRKKGDLTASIQKEKARLNNKRLLKGLACLDDFNTKKLIKLKAKLAFVEERIEKIDDELPFVKVKYIHQTFKSIFGHGLFVGQDDRDTSAHEGLFNLFILLKKAVLLVLLGAFALLSIRQLEFELSVTFFVMIALRICQILLAIYSGVSAGDEFIVILCDAYMVRARYLQSYFDTAKGIVKPITIHEVSLESIQEEVVKDVAYDLGDKEEESLKREAKALQEKVEMQGG